MQINATMCLNVMPSKEGDCIPKMLAILIEERFGQPWAEKNVRTSGAPHTGKPKAISKIVWVDNERVSTFGFKCWRCDGDD